VRLDTGRRRADPKLEHIEVQDTMQADAIGAAREFAGRRVVAFMSNNHIDADLAVEVFILEPDVSNPLGADVMLASPQRDRPLLRLGR
jgi:uncharacterized protein YbcI